MNRGAGTVQMLDEGLQAALVLEHIGLVVTLVHELDAHPGIQERELAQPFRQNLVVEGDVRGFISQHRTLDAAVKSLKRDQNQCHALGGGAYSDAVIIDKTVGQVVNLEDLYS